MRCRRGGLSKGPPSLAVCRRRLPGVLDIAGGGTARCGDAEEHVRTRGEPHWHVPRTQDGAPGWPHQQPESMSLLGWPSRSPILRARHVSVRFSPGARAGRLVLQQCAPEGATVYLRGPLLEPSTYSEMTLGSMITDENPGMGRFQT